MSDTTLLRVDRLTKEFRLTTGFSGRYVGTLRAVDEIDLELFRGETLGLVGESGCGKTTTGRCIIRAIEPTHGSVVFHSKDSDAPCDLASLKRHEMMDVWKKIRLIFQDPYSSLNPRMNVFDILSAGLRSHGSRLSNRELRDRVAPLLDAVGLNPDHMRRYPHAFSGGQRQRIAIARALVTEPELVIADEPVSALDVSVQAQVLRLLDRLKAVYDLTFLFVAHNLSVVQYMCDRVAVMYMGRIVELSPTKQLYDSPWHPYTEMLLASIPVLDPREKRPSTVVRGEVGDLVNPPKGCRFHPRCRFADEVCRTQIPALRRVATAGGQVRQVACHHAESLDLAGAVPNS